MNRVYAGAGCIMLLIAGFVGADSISSTIVCDGATWVASSVIGPGQTYAANFFTTNFAYLMRDLTVNDAGEVKSGTVAESSGPLSIDEYSGKDINQITDKNRCVFDETLNRTRNQNQIRYMGLMEGGIYSSTRILSREKTSASTMVNGSGMVLARAKYEDGMNQTTHASDVAGRLNMTEYIIFGGLE